MALLLLSLWRARRLTDTATEISDPIWRQEAAEIGRRLGCSREVRLLTSDRVQTPMAGELWRPTIFLPNRALAWPAEYRRAVLGHEVAHLTGHDPRRRLAARVMLAIYWFHPLAWLAAHLDAQACEDACDEAVVRDLDVRPSAYACILLELSRTSRLPLAAVALPMARRASLERRLLRILRGSSTASHGRFPAPALVCGALAVIVGASQPTARGFQESAAPPGILEVQEVRTPPGASGALRAGPTSQTDPAHHIGVPAQDELGCHLIVPETARLSARRPSPAAVMTMTEVVAASGFTRAFERKFGDLTLCLLVEGVSGPTRGLPSEMLGKSERAALEVGSGALRQRLDIARAGGDRMPTRFLASGSPKPIDDAVLRWQRQTVNVLDLTWQLAHLRGDVQTLNAKLEAVPDGPAHQAGRDALEGELRALDHRRRTAELETRRETELAELRRTVQAIGTPIDAALQEQQFRAALAAVR
jgi:hypothetical protein